MTKMTSSAICSKGTMALRIEFNTTCRPVQSSVASTLIILLS